MTILCDSREQKWEHVRDWFDRNGQMWFRNKLPVGDYARQDNMTLIVDRKASLNEVENNLIHQHDRFRRECERAVEMGVKLIILVEDTAVKRLDDVPEWGNPRFRRWNKLDALHAQGKMLHKRIPGKPPVDGPTLYKIMRTMADRYGIEWRFCKRQQVGETICKILETLPTPPKAG